MDITKPKAQSRATQPFEIKTRPLMAHDAATSSPGVTNASNIEDTPETSAPSVAKSKHTVITPLHDSKELVTETPPSTSSPAASQSGGITEESSETSSPTAAPEEQKTPTVKAASSISDDAPSVETKPTDSAKPTAATRKAVAEAEEAAKRDAELQEYINSHRFFVPINAVAHKRSIEVSIVLTLLVTILAVLLIDLMLDSGIVLLLQKIPHTHFFTT